MKKQILSIALGLVIIAMGTTTYAADKNPVSSKITPNEKVLKNFNKQFKSSESPSISLLKDGFILQTQVEGHNVTSAYDKKGNWLYTLTFYPTENLEKNIIDIVKDNYNNYFISGMEKVDQSGNESVFVVHMENNDSFKTLRVVGNEVELVQDFKKG